MVLGRIFKHLGTAHDQHTHNPNHHTVDGVEFEDVKTVGGRNYARYRLLETFPIPNGQWGLPAAERDKLYEWKRGWEKKLTDMGVRSVKIIEERFYGDPTKTPQMVVWMTSKPKTQEQKVKAEEKAHKPKTVGKLSYVKNDKGPFANRYAKYRLADEHNITFNLVERPRPHGPELGLSDEDIAKYRAWWGEKKAFLKQNGVYGKSTDGMSLESISPDKKTVTYAIGFETTPKEVSQVSDSASAAKKKLVSVYVDMTPEQEKLVDSALELIDKVIDIKTDVKPLPFRRLSGKSRFLGVYYAGREVTLSAKNKEEQAINTSLHEVGHFVDDIAGDVTGGLKNTPETKALLKALRESVSVKGIQAGILNKADEFRQNYPEVKVSDWSFSQRRHLSYLLQANECFARAFAQYITLRAGAHNVIEHELADERLSAWDDDDFEPIAKAFDDLFTSLGWKK